MKDSDILLQHNVLPDKILQDLFWRHWLPQKFHIKMQELVQCSEITPNRYSPALLKFQPAIKNQQQIKD